MDTVAIFGSLGIAVGYPQYLVLSVCEGFMASQV
jgi:hypothetical protein